MWSGRGAGHVGPCDGCAFYSHGDMKPGIFWPKQCHNLSYAFRGSLCLLCGVGESAEIEAEMPLA